MKKEPIEQIDEQYLCYVNHDNKEHQEKYDILYSVYENEKSRNKIYSDALLFKQKQYDELHKKYDKIHKEYILLENKYNDLEREYNLLLNNNKLNNICNI